MTANTRVRAVRADKRRQHGGAALLSALRGRASAAMGRPAGRLAVALAAAAGASGVAAGAYGAHGSGRLAEDEHAARIYDTANRYHLLCAPTILGLAAIARAAPRYSFVQSVPVALLATGTCLFSGSLYHSALTGSPSLKRVAPIGGGLIMVRVVSATLCEPPHRLHASSCRSLSALAPLLPPLPRLLTRCARRLVGPAPRCSSVRAARGCH